jgi:pyruvate/2-oxoglutarate dehydrogenase complex dihydrolipoamide acyltransferase (E2) component
MAGENVPSESFKETLKDENVNEAVSSDDAQAGTTAGLTDEGADPGQTMAQETADQMETALDPEEPVNDRLEPQEPAEADERSAYNNPDRNVEGYQYDAPGEQTRGTFTVIDITGTPHEIARKEDRGGGQLVMISTEGAEFIPHPSGGVQQYDPDLHGGGLNANDDDTVQDQEGDREPPGPADLSEKTEAARAAEDLDEAKGIDRTGDDQLQDPGTGKAPVENIARAEEAAREEKLTPEELNNPNPGPAEANLGETTADETSAGAATETPAGVNEEGDGFEGDGGDEQTEPSEVMGGADGPLPQPSNKPPTSTTPPPPPPTPEATEAAEKLAKEEGIDLKDVKGTGTDGRITQPDVAEAAEKKDKKQ